MAVLKFIFSPLRLLGNTLYSLVCILFGLAYLALEILFKLVILAFKACLWIIGIIIMLAFPPVTLVLIFLHLRSRKKNERQSKVHL